MADGKPAAAPLFSLVCCRAGTHDVAFAASEVLALGASPPDAPWIEARLGLARPVSAGALPGLRQGLCFRDSPSSPGGWLNVGAPVRLVSLPRDDLHPLPLLVEACLRLRGAVMGLAVERPTGPGESPEKRDPLFGSVAHKDKTLERHDRIRSSARRSGIEPVEGPVESIVLLLDPARLLGGVTGDNRP